MRGPRAGESDPFHPRRRRRRVVERGPRTAPRGRSRWHTAARLDPERRSRHVAARDLVQRGPGAFRACGGRLASRRLRIVVPARALPLGQHRDRDERTLPAPRRQLPRPPGRRSAARGVARQGPLPAPGSHAPRLRSTPFLHRGSRFPGRARPGAPPARGGGQELPDHYRRPKRFGPRRPGPDGGPPPGAGRRLRGDPLRLLGIPWRGDGDGRTRAGRARECPRLGPHGGGRGTHQPRRRAHRQPRSRGALGELDGGLRPSRRRRRTLRHRARGSPGALPRPRRLDTGRQGLPVDAGAMAPRRAHPHAQRARIAHRVRIRAGARRAQDAHPRSCARTRAKAT